MLKTLQVWTGTFPTLDATGALATPSVGPVGTLYVAGDANAAVVTISGSNPYKFSVALPALTAGQSVEMYVTATIAGIATSTVVDKDIADTAYGSEALRPTVAGRTLGVDASGAINSVLGTVSANVTQIDGETDPVDNLVLALGTGGLVEKLNSMLEAAGQDYRFTAEALAEGPSGGGGSGAISYTFTVNDGVTPIDGVEVWVSTDINGVNVVAGTLSTDALGHVSFMLDAGSYYVWMQRTGYNFTNPTAFTVS